MGEATGFYSSCCELNVAYLFHLTIALLDGVTTSYSSVPNMVPVCTHFLEFRESWALEQATRSRMIGMSPNLFMTNQTLSSAGPHIKLEFLS